MSDPYLDLLQQILDELKAIRHELSEPLEPITIEEIQRSAQVVFDTIAKAAEEQRQLRDLAMQAERLVRQ